MARLVTSGAETGTFGGYAGDGTAGGTAPTFDTTHVHTGSKAFKCVAAAAAGSDVYWKPSSGAMTPLGNTLWVQQYIYFETLPGANSYLTEAYDTSGTARFALKLDATGHPYIASNSGSGWVNIGSVSATALTTGAWHRIVIVLNVPTSGNGTSGLYVDGVTVVDPATSAAVANTAIGEVAVGMVYAGAATTIWVDDVAVNDSTGSSDNGMPAPVTPAATTGVYIATSSGWEQSTGPMKLATSSGWV